MRWSRLARLSARGVLRSVRCGQDGLVATRRDGLGATFLRIDTIEAAITSTLALLTDNPVGYVVGSGSGRPVARRTSSGGRRGEQRHGSAARLGDPRAGLRGAPALRPGRVQRPVGASAAGRDPDRGDARPRRAHLAASAAPPVGATVRAASRHRQRRRPRWIDWLTQPHS